jgi:hypothetical protein
MLISLIKIQDLLVAHDPAHNPFSPWPPYPWQGLPEGRTTSTRLRIEKSVRRMRRMPSGSRISTSASTG